MGGGGEGRENEKGTRPRRFKGAIVLILYPSGGRTWQDFCRDLYPCWFEWWVATMMYGHTYSKKMDQPGKVANLARGQLNRENQYFPVRVCA